MSAFRPPCITGMRLAAPVFFLAALLSAAPIGAAELDLPDLVIPRRSRQDIPQPYVRLDIDADWIARLPRFRRLYPVAAEEESFFSSMPVPNPPFAGPPLPALADRRIPSGVYGAQLPIMLLTQPDDSEKGRSPDRRKRIDANIPLRCGGKPTWRS